MNQTITLLLCCILSQTVYSFCGFYVAKADAKLFNRASQVVLVRQEDKTVLTMANDFQGDPKAFAVVIPVPTFIEAGQIHIGDKTIIDHLDAYTAPRLVEYFDEDPCVRLRYAAPALEMTEGAAEDRVSRKKNSRGVTVEAAYTIGEYDIVILSAQESHSLAAWLEENGYQMPAGAAPVLGSYIKQNMRFFVAKVNLQAQAKLGFSYLRPIQVAYESPKFMLPIRLGTVNAIDHQELFIYTLTTKGRVETTNYRTVKLPTDSTLPVYIKKEFADFYRALFDQQVKQTGMKTVFLEYAWDMNWCDPCAGDPLSVKELRDLGVFWLQDAIRENNMRDVFVTRLHVRYNAENFPEDLIFQETADRSNFQGRYVLQHPWTGDSTCREAERYKADLMRRHEREAQTLASLTGWDLEEIRTKMNITSSPSSNDKAWWQKLWGQ